MDKRYNIKARVETITQSTRLTDLQFGGWMAVNIGSASASVMGIPLLPTEGLDFTKSVPAGSFWTQPINIEITPGAAIRLVRLIYEEIK